MVLGCGFSWMLAHAGASALCSATPIDATIIAEEKTRRFMQTLTQTFAHIRTGLAIFDRDRRLTMFNPALMDLTGLEAEWLALRPTLNSFFDQLRNRNTLPEPKDYKSWRDRLDWIEEEANNGQFAEVWSLPDGQVFRVCARPHPDGGLAILIEDISDEMALTRRFRAELELSQSVINAMDEAVVVFSPAGTQLMANEAYATLWDVDEAGPDAPITAPTILDANKLWQTRAKPAPLWGEIREFVSALTQRAEWSDTGHLVDGVGLACRVVPLTGGATLVSFTEAEPIAVFAPRHRTEARAN
jgi:PAS domain-containing protein